MSKPVVEEHKELVHYTSAAGLTGILSNQALWATHSSFLNDSTEITLFFDRRLRRLMETAIRKELPTDSDDNIKGLTAEITESLRTVTLQFNQPYVASFCSAKDDRTRNDGLLSQWRGYGKEGGYGIVFNTVGLQKLLEAESRDYWYQHMEWGDVHYYQDTSDAASAAAEIKEAEGTLQDAVRAFIKSHSVKALEPTFQSVASLSCLYKHWGFHEEREVRIVAIPPNEALVTQERATGEARPTRIPKSFVRNGCPVPYIELFGRGSNTGESDSLPITRVLIGPHPQRELRRRAVEIMLAARNNRAEVLISEIPYLGT
jgi:hypothetical protein